MQTAEVLTEKIIKFLQLHPVSNIDEVKTQIKGIVEMVQKDALDPVPEDGYEKEVKEEPKDTQSA